MLELGYDAVVCLHLGLVVILIQLRRHIAFVLWILMREVRVHFVIDYRLFLNFGKHFSVVVLVAFVVVVLPEVYVGFLEAADLVQTIQRRESQHNNYYRYYEFVKSVM